MQLILSMLLASCTTVEDGVGTAGYDLCDIVSSQVECACTFLGDEECVIMGDDLTVCKGTHWPERNAVVCE